MKQLCWGKKTKRKKEKERCNNVFVKLSMLQKVVERLTCVLECWNSGNKTVLLLKCERKLVDLFNFR